MSGQFDTSGYVPEHGNEAMVLLWPDLSPFVQGYVEAMFARSGAEPDECPTCGAPDGRRHPALVCGGEAQICPDAWHLIGFRFSDLAPETLARIIADCERFKADGYGWADDDATDGALFWRTRQAGEWADVEFLRLRPYLGEDGKVYLRDAGQ